jgi:uncharacterized DUF497 family protein
VSGFNWDAENVDHIARHDVTPQEIEEVFNDDPEYALNYTKDGEERFQAFGVTVQGRYLTVAYTEREAMIRPITVWDMNRKERKNYDAKKITQQTRRRA